MSWAQISLEAINILINTLTKNAIINALWIPTEYDIDHPESEKACPLSNSRALGSLGC